MRQTINRSILIALLFSIACTLPVFASETTAVGKLKRGVTNIVTFPFPIIMCPVSLLRAKKPTPFQVVGSVLGVIPGTVKSLVKGISGATDLVLFWFPMFDGFLEEESLYPDPCAIRYDSEWLDLLNI